MVVLVLGAGGLLGRALQAELPALELSVAALTHGDVDITDLAQINHAIGAHHPDVVINCAAYTRVDDAEAHEAEAHRINATGAQQVADACAHSKVRVVYPSTDYVFDGSGSTPWSPDNQPNPINAYGRSKLAGEIATQRAPDHLVVRTSWLFGAGGPNFVRTVINRLSAGEAMRVVNDQTGTPTYANDLAVAIGQLLRRDVPSGLYHVSNSGATTWFEYARAIARSMGREELITACATADLPRSARRPLYSVLDTSETDRLIGPLRDWRAAVTDALSTHDF